MKLEEGKVYECKNGNKVKVKRSNLPYYKFTVKENLPSEEGFIDTNTSEVWNENGIAYHDDCGYNFIREVS